MPIEKEVSDGEIEKKSETDVARKKRGKIYSDVEKEKVKNIVKRVELERSKKKPLKRKALESISLEDKRTRVTRQQSNAAQKSNDPITNRKKVQEIVKKIEAGWLKGKSKRGADEDVSKEEKRVRTSRRIADKNLSAKKDSSAPSYDVW